MNKLIFIFIVNVTFFMGAYASSETVREHHKTVKPISAKKIQHLDKKLTKHKARKRSFKTQKEFQRKSQRNIQRKQVHRSSKHLAPHQSSHKRVQRKQHYNNGYTYNPKRYREPYRPIRQRGYRAVKRGWLLAYRYDRAGFYDNNGYYYGYFNRYGYYFEDVFYSYDRYYTFRDRVRGRGLFDHRYYMPENADYYGFIDSFFSSFERY